jgi:hypothetical protein
MWRINPDLPRAAGQDLPFGTVYSIIFPQFTQIHRNKVEFGGDV